MFWVYIRKSLFNDQIASTKLNFRHPLGVYGTISVLYAPSTGRLANLNVNNFTEIKAAVINRHRILHDEKDSFKIKFNDA